MAEVMTFIGPILDGWWYNKHSSAILLTRSKENKMKDQTFHMGYFFSRNHAVAGSISAIVEKVVQAKYPALRVTMAQDNYDINGQPLHTMRITGQGLTQPVIEGIKAFADGAIQMAKELVK